MKIKPRRIEKVVIINPRHSWDNTPFSLLHPMPSEGPVVIGRVLDKMGYEVRVIDECLTRLYPESPLWKSIREADMVGVSAMTCTENRAYKLLRRAKSLNSELVCIAGGMGPTSNSAKALNKGADVVVVGEGVETIRKLVLAFRDGADAKSIKGIAWQEGGKIRYSQPRPLIHHLDEVPFADWSLLVNSEKVKIRPITFSAGCPWGCDFCAVSKFYGRRWRHRSVENALAYLKHAYQAGSPLVWTGDIVVFLADDNIAVDPQWTKKVFEGIAQLSLPRLSIAVQMRADASQDQELMDLFKQAGGDRILFGYEDISQKGLQSLNKNQTKQDIFNSIEQCRKRNLKISGMFILGLDSHTPSTGVEMADFALKNDLDSFILWIRCPFPGTTETKRLTQQGRLLNIPTHYRNAQFVVFEPANMSAEELQIAHLKALRRFYKPSHILRVKNWGRGKMTRDHLLFWAGHYYVKKQEKQARAFVEKYLTK